MDVPVRGQGLDIIYACGICFVNLIYNYYNNSCMKKLCEYAFVFYKEVFSPLNYHHKKRVKYKSMYIFLDKYHCTFNVTRSTNFL